MSAPRRLAFCALLVFCCAGSAASQGAVLVVDAGGGGGFVDIQDAVDAAAPGDVVLVKAGAYPGFSINGKALSVQAEAGASVTLDSSALIENLGPGQGVVLRGLDISPTAPSFGLFDLRMNVGPVWVESCTGDGAAMFQANQAAYLRCEFITPTTASGMSSFDSSVTAYDVTVQAGDGADGVLDVKLGIPLNGSPGTSGYRATNGDEIFLSGSSFTGGNGGDGLEPDAPDPCSHGGAGGNGLAVFALDPIVRVQAVSFAGGVGGTGGSGCNDGGPGQPQDLVPGAPAPFPLPGPYRSLSANSPVREGQTLVVRFEGQPGDAAFLMFSFSQSHLFAAKFRGAFLVENPTFFPTPFVLPASGALDLDIFVPELGPGLESVNLFLGSFFFEVATGKKFLGSSSAVVLLDGAF